MSKRIEGSFNEKWDGLAAMGNENHWSSWIASLEKEVESAHEGHLSGAFLYVAWMLMSAEFIFHQLRLLLYVQGDFKNQEVFDYSYSKLESSVAGNMTPQIREDLRFVLGVRHLLVHKGFPNPQEVPTHRRKGEPSGEEILEIRNQVKEPKNFESVRQRFERVRAWLYENSEGFSFGI